MLILTRRPGQKVAIGDGIMVTVLEVAGDRIKLGIDAPADVLILRQELCEAVKEENRAALRQRGSELRATLESLRHWMRPGATFERPGSRDRSADGA